MGIRYAFEVLNRQWHGRRGMDGILAEIGKNSDDFRIIGSISFAKITQSMHLTLFILSQFGLSIIRIKWINRSSL